jgi:acyl-CoA thioester hydrolase
MLISETHIRVRYAETDQMGVVYYGNYAQYFEVGRAEAVRSLGYTYKDMEAEGVMMPVVDMQMRFLRPAKYDDLLTVKTMVKEMPHSSKITFHSEIYNEAGELLVTGQVSLMFIEIATMKRTVMPPDLKQKMEVRFNSQAS